MPARLHRQVLGALRRAGRRRRAPRDRRGLLRLHGRREPEVRQAARAPDARRLGRARVRAGRPAARRHRGAPAGAREVGRRASATAPTPTSSPSPRTSSRWPCRSSTCAAGGSAASAGGSPRRSRDRARGRRATCSSSSTAARPASPCRARCSSRCCPTTPRTLGQWLSELRGSRVDLRVPQRGDKRTLMETVARNATQSLARHKVARAGDLTARQPGPAAAPGVPRARRVAAAHRVLRHQPRPGHPGRRARWSSSRTAWRARASTAGSSCAARTRPATTDDTAAMHEVLTRRFRRYLKEPRRAARARRRAETGRPTRFAYPPQPRRRRRRSAAGQRRGPRHRGPRHRRRRRRRAGQAARGGVGAGAGLPGHPAPHQRGPLPAAAAARRGAPLRDHLPPPAARQGHDDQPLDGIPGLGRRGARRCCGTSVRSSGSGLRTSTNSPRSAASGLRWLRPSGAS